MSHEDPFLGLDLDGCLINGNICPSAQAIIDQCDSYTEISPSGEGIRIIGTGKIPVGFDNKYDMTGDGFKALEIYDKLRYLTITGDVLGEPREIKPIDLNRITLPQSKSADPGKKSKPLGMANHELLLNRIRADKEGMKFTMLYDHGSLVDYGGDQSRADMALVTILAKWTNFDPVLLDQLFRGSALIREKWDKVHHADGSTYGEMTIQRVLENRPIFHKNEIEGFLRFHYDFQFNVVLERVEMRRRGEEQWQIVDDYEFNSIHRHIQNKSGQIGHQALHGILQSDFTPKFDPFMEYFTKLPK